MLADLDLLLTAVFATADDLLPEKDRNARRSVTDAEVVTLAVAQEMMGIDHDAEFLAIAHKRLRHLFPKLPKQPGYWKRRQRCSDTIEWLISIFAADSPGYRDTVVLLDSTPVECGRSVETARRSQLADACGYGYSRSHSRWFWGMRLHLLAAPDGTPRAAILAPADQKEREVALRLLPIGLHGGETIVADKGYAGRELAATVAERHDALILRPNRKNEPGHDPHLAPIRQYIESIFWTLKDRLGLERHNTRTLHGLRARIATKLLALAAGVWLNHYLHRPTRAFADLSH
ncbi:MAG: IS982 family transposase [Solirubrobacterales bacterium]|nr:IS982 family transposase [Solirubrobacterales bacterium]MBV9838695.1 IS982 family transposase [Solirubrobacterales bacterium]